MPKFASLAVKKRAFCITNFHQRNLFVVGSGEFYDSLIIRRRLLLLHNGWCEKATMFYCLPDPVTISLLRYVWGKIFLRIVHKGNSVISEETAINYITDDHSSLHTRPSIAINISKVWPCCVYKMKKSRSSFLLNYFDWEWGMTLVKIWKFVKLLCTVWLIYGTPTPQLQIHLQIEYDYFNNLLLECFDLSFDVLTQLPKSFSTRDEGGETKRWYYILLVLSSTSAHLNEYKNTCISFTHN